MEYNKTKQETWKDIPGYEGYYQISDKGNVKTISRRISNGHWTYDKNLPQINHINGNKKDNRLENLEWCDNSYNQLHAWATGLQKPHYCGGGCSKKKVAMLDDNGNTEMEFESIRSASEYMGCSSPANMSHLLNGKGKLKSIYGKRFRFV